MFLDDEIVQIVKSSDLSTSVEIGFCIHRVHEAVTTNILDKVKQLADAAPYVDRQDIRTAIKKAATLYEMAVDKLEKESSKFAILKRSAIRDYWLSERSPLVKII